ncbi:MAG: stress responsive alpha-beta barrel domain-containing protein [Bacteroidetes bacterium HGW-Bacteroidetes-13]|nr:MAG: stress responsive alpha-beta barrel domain-containing protein [Bacteroidetes bacterium HGW-Bacteroidetes-13]
MKRNILFLLMLTVGISFGQTANHAETMKIQANKAQIINDSVLRHVVMFKFKTGTSPAKITEIENAFAALQTKIPQIASYEWGLNNSPEGLNKGFTHCFFLTFRSEADRGIYLPHPDHKAFGALLGPILEDVLVLDYWTKL